MPFGSPPPTNPLRATAPLLYAGPHDSEGRYETIGTCFAFRQAQYFLTARHCVRDIEPDRLFIGIDLGHGVQLAQPVVEIVHHDTADISLLLSGSHPDVTPFWGLKPQLALGEGFMAYGFPAEVLHGGSQPAPRMFRGYYQRFPEIMYKSPATGSLYWAAELNIPCPAGLSGGPLFSPDDHRIVTGLVTENLQSFTVVESWEEERMRGKVRSIESRQIINYGIGLLLSGITEWLDKHIPPHPSLPIPRLQ